MIPANVTKARWIETSCIPQATREESRAPSQAANTPPPRPAATSIGQCTPMATRLKPASEASRISANRQLRPRR